MTNKRLKWTKETIHKESLQYTTRKDFRKHNNAAYTQASKLKILDDVCSHMTRLNRIIKDEEIFSEALKYEHRVDFARQSQSFYDAAIKRGLLEQVCSHMVPKTKPPYYSDKEIKEAVCKYDTYKEFMEHENGIYCFLQRHKKLEKYLSELSKVKHDPYTKEEVMEIAKNYNTISEMGKHKSGALKAAVRLGIFDEIKSHMKVNKRTYTYDELKEEALKYNHKSEFSKYSRNFYNVAYRRKILNEICSHMTPLHTWTPDCRNVLYIWKVADDDINHLGMPLYKIGITSKKLQHKRIKDVASKAKFKYEVIYYKKREDCLVLEKQLLTIGTNPELVGFDGSCEFRAWDDQDLKAALSHL